MSKHGITIEFDTALLGKRYTNLAKVPDRQFAVNVDDGKKKAEMLIYDVIGMDFFGEGITAKRVEQELAALGEVDELLVLINSPGGLIYEGLGIYNALSRFPATVITHNVGAAWSCASWILQAGDERLMSENASWMTHNAMGGAFGDYKYLQKESEILLKMNRNIADTYAKRTGRRAETFLAMMEEETWLDAKEAADGRLVDRVVPAKTGAKNLDPSAFGFNRKFNQARSNEEMEPNPNMPMVGDRVKLVVPPHMEGHDEGTVRQVVHSVLGIEFDSDPGRVHQWYLVSDVMVIEAAEPMNRKPAFSDKAYRARSRALEMEVS